MSGTFLLLWNFLAIKHNKHKILNVLKILFGKVIKKLLDIVVGSPDKDNTIIDEFVSQFQFFLKITQNLQTIQMKVGSNRHQWECLGNWTPIISDHHPQWKEHFWVYMYHFQVLCTQWFCPSMKESCAKDPLRHLHLDNSDGYLPPTLLFFTVFGGLGTFTPCLLNIDIKDWPCCIFNSDFGAKN